MLLWRYGTEYGHKYRSQIKRFKNETFLVLTIPLLNKLIKQFLSFVCISNTVLIFSPHRYKADKVFRFKLIPISLQLPLLVSYPNKDFFPHTWWWYITAHRTIPIIASQAQVGCPLLTNGDKGDDYTLVGPPHFPFVVLQWGLLVL